MKILVLGGGGREHALVWKLRQSPRVSHLYCAPGNGGIADEAECLAVDLKSLESLTALAARVKPDLTVVGPELPLTLGVVDEFTRRGWPVFGPAEAAAQLDSSIEMKALVRLDFTRPLEPFHLLFTTSADGPRDKDPTQTFNPKG